MYYNYEGLSTDKSKDYILSRIDAAGGARTIIDDAALHAVASFSQGTPRIINSVMTHALIIGAQLQALTINTEIILSASNNLSLSYTDRIPGYLLVCFGIRQIKGVLWLKYLSMPRLRRKWKLS